jgi:uncharacterized membrane protein
MLGVVVLPHLLPEIASHMEYFRKIVEIAGTTIDAAGVLIIVIGALVATWRFLLQWRGVTGLSYRRYRQDIGMAVLLGLEFLIAGDIIRTVVFWRCSSPSSA